MILGIGVDIVETARIRAIHDKYGDSFAQKLQVSIEELEYIRDKKKDMIEYLGSVWASKEAVYKALYQSGYRLTHMNEIKMSRSDPFPEVIAPSYEGIRVHLSLSHEKGAIVAFAIVEKTG